MVHMKTACLHVALRKRNSAAISPVELFKCSKDSASLVVCIEKNFLDLGFRFFVSDVTSGALLGHFGLHLLDLGPNR